MASALRTDFADYRRSRISDQPDALAAAPAVKRQRLVDPIPHQ